MSGGTRPGHESRFEDLPARGGAAPRCRATRGLVSRGRLRLCPDECVARGPGRVDRRAPSGGDSESLWDDRVQPAHCLGRTRGILKQPRLVVGLEFDGYVRSHGHLWLYDCRHHPSLLHRLRRAPPGLLCTAHGHAGLRARRHGPIVGTIIRTASGVLALEAQIVLSAEWVASISIEPSAADVVLPILIPLVIAALGMGGGTILFTRRRRTRKALSGSPVLTLGDSGAARDPELSWQPNGRGTDPRRRGFVSLAFVLVGASLLLAYLGLGPRAGFGYWNLGFLGTIVVLVVGAAVGMLLFGGVGRPSFVAVAADGFRLWYDSPYDRHLNDTVFPWDEIVDIHMTSGKGAHWVLRRTTGQFTNLYVLKGRNLNLLLNDCATRRTASERCYVRPM